MVLWLHFVADGRAEFNFLKAVFIWVVGFERHNIIDDVLPIIPTYASVALEVYVRSIGRSRALFIGSNQSLVDLAYIGSNACRTSQHPRPSARQFLYLACLLSIGGDSRN